MILVALLVLHLGMLRPAAMVSGATETIHVVTPENQIADRVSEVNETVEDADGDTYVQAYRELQNSPAERRHPFGSYDEEPPYNTLSHSSYIEEDVYPDFNYKPPQQHKYHHHHHPHKPPHPVVYGPPSPVSYYHHHHHHPEPVTHHTIIGYPVESHFHHLTSFLHKFGLHKVFKLLVKIFVLKIILKFVAVVFFFFVLPSFFPREKNKDKDESEEDRVLNNLNDITDMVWNGIMENEMMDEDDEDKSEEEENNQEEDHHHHQGDKSGEELDETDHDLLDKVIKDWKEENFGGPDKSSAVKFILNCIDTVNRVLSAMLGYLKMKNNNMDHLDSLMLNRISLYGTTHLSLTSLDHAAAVADKALEATSTPPGIPPGSNWGSVATPTAPGSNFGAEELDTGTTEPVKQMVQAWPKITAG